MPASNIALLSAKCMRTSWPSVWCLRSETCFANSIQVPGGVSEPGPSAHHSAMVLVRSVSVALYVSTSTDWRQNSKLPSAAGGLIANWS